MTFTDGNGEVIMIDGAEKYGVLQMGLDSVRLSTPSQMKNTSSHGSALCVHIDAWVGLPMSLSVRSVFMCMAAS